MDFPCYVLDLDGVVYLGNEPVPGVSDSIKRVQDKGSKVFFLTNNSTRTRDAYVKTLSGFGIDTDKDHVVTSAYAAAVYIREEFGKTRVYPVGEEGLVRELESEGHRICQEACAVVVAGLDRRFTYEKMALAQKLILEGADFIATNLDKTLITEGEPLPGGGAVVKGIEVASGKKPVVVGKPSPIIGRILLAKAGFKPKDILMVGDRLATDIAFGKAVGMKTALVLSGDDSREDIKDSYIKPDYILESF